MEYDVCLFSPVGRKITNCVKFIPASLFLAILLSAPGNAHEHFPFVAWVFADDVSVRAGANINFEKIDTLKKGDTVVVLGHYYGWYKIQPPATTKSYIRSDYLRIKEGTYFAQVLGDRVNVRAAAFSESSSLGEVNRGTWVMVLDKGHGWCRVRPPAGTVAWVHQDFLKFQSAAPKGEES